MSICPRLVAVSEAGVEATAPAGSRRRYRSPLREQRAAETRAALIAAARRLFLARGWAGTGMREVAAEAGVATETLYSHFSSKRVLLRAALDVGVVGDDRPVRLAERPEFVAIGRGRRAERLAAAANVLTSIQQRTATFSGVLREAASTDEEIAAMLHELRERQREDTADAIELLLGRPPTPVERDGVWAIVSPEVFLLLVDGSGWSAEQYEAWIAQTLDRVLPRA
jgi:AcrR family transcriptional regulator